MFSYLSCSLKKRKITCKSGSGKSTKVAEAADVVYGMR